MKDEYAKAGVPMMPVVRGEDETRRQILLYTVLLVAITVLPFAGGLFGIFYLVARDRCSAACSCAFAWVLFRDGERRSALRLYLFSLAYLALLFGAMVFDAQSSASCGAAGRPKSGRPR